MKAAAIATGDWGNCSWSSSLSLSEHLEAQVQRDLKQSQWLERQQSFLKSRSEAAANKAREEEEERERERQLEQQRQDAAAEALAEELARLEELDDGTDIPPWHRGEAALAKPAWLLELLVKVAEKEDVSEVYKRYKQPQTLPAKQEIQGIKQAARIEEQNTNRIFKTPQALPPKKEAQVVRQAIVQEEIEYYEIFEEEVVEEELRLDDEESVVEEEIILEEVWEEEISVDDEEEELSVLSDLFEEIKYILEVDGTIEQPAPASTAVKAAEVDSPITTPTKKSSEMPKYIHLHQNDDQSDDDNELEEEQQSYQVPWKNFKLKPRISPQDLTSTKILQTQRPEILKPAFSPPKKALLTNIVQEKLKKRTVLRKPSFTATKEELKSNIVQEKLAMKPILARFDPKVTKKELQTNVVQQKLAKKPVLQKPSFTATKADLTHNIVTEKLAKKPNIKQLQANFLVSKKELQTIIVKEKLKNPEALSMPPNTKGLVPQQSTKQVTESPKSDSSYDSNKCTVAWTNFKLRRTSPTLESKSLEEKEEKSTLTILSNVNNTQGKLARNPKRDSIKVAAIKQDMVSPKQNQKGKTELSLLGPSALLSPANGNGSLRSEKPLWMQRTLALQQSFRELESESDAESAGSNAEKTPDAAWQNYRLKPTSK